MAKETTNRFHEYTMAVLGNKGVTCKDVAKAVGVARQYAWEISKRPTLIIGKRLGLMEALSRFYGEPMSKLAFFAGINPWANRLTMEQQSAVWEFVERLVKSKETGEGKPPPVAYNNLLAELFGGVELIDNSAVTEILRRDTSTET